MKDASRVCIELLLKANPVAASSKILSEKQIVGYKAEEKALSFLEEHGLILVERNFRCRFGEINLIMRDNDVLVFVEVRKRKNSTFGGAAASVSYAKQQRLVRTARFYLSGNHRIPVCRFDVFVLDGDRCQWLKNVIEVE